MPEEISQPQQSRFKIMMQLILFVKPLAGFMFLAVSAGVAGYLCAIALPVLGVAALLLPNQLTNILLVLIAAAILRGLLRYGEQLCNHYIAFRLLALLRDKIFMALRRLCPAKLEGRNKGDLIAMITSDIELLEVFYAHTISPVLIAIFTSIILLVMQMQFHPFLALTALLAYCTVGILLPIYNTHTGKTNGQKYREGFGDLSGHMLDSLQGLREVVQFQAGQQRLDEMSNHISILGNLQKKLKQCEGKNKAATDCAILFFTAIQIFLAVWLAKQNLIGTEQAVLSMVLLMSSFGPVIALSSLSNNLLQTLASGQRVLQLLEEEPETEEKNEGLVVDFQSAELQKVNFAYQQEQILKDFHLKIPAQTLLGIQGKSGSGKSTILKLLMRFWDPQQGRITMSGHNLKEIATNCLRQNQGYCTQETYLFHDTIAENIALSKPDASPQQIEQAAKKAALHQFISQLPQGYQTMLGQKDIGLSGGQQQRIGMARIFLHDAPFLLLDEPTSNLDSLNESIILKSLQENRAGKTIILVSHRPSTLRIADHIIQMEQHRFS